MRRMVSSLTPQIQAAPMADTAFLLIIFFMLTATMTAKKGLDQSFSEEEGAVSPAILLAVDGQGQVQLDGTPIGLISSESCAAAIRAQSAEKGQTYWLQMDQKAPYQIFIKTLETLQLCRAQEPRVEWVIPDGDQVLWYNAASLQGQ
ncbi:MAG: biopolymer transporter ExbD [Acidobacteria bacterium]|nr:biopolymer transporter ExbD [Acidobacteriota bacterium]MCB9397817.1 biopolymer transporter ExbD [Acidobacteriota bacterium]